MPGRRTEREAHDMAAFAGRVARAMVRRAGEGDLEALAALRTIRDDVESAIGDAARALHDDFHSPYSWAEIGRSLGITKQAAYQSFHRQPEVDAG